MTAELSPLNQGATVYAIGDIHGRLDLLNQIIDEIDRDAALHGSDSLTITLGDYVDRGPNSYGVIERLRKNPFPGRYVALKGNHEELLETFLIQPETCAHWRRLGGLETLHSYGVPVRSLLVGRNYGAAAEALRAAMPGGHHDFLTTLKTSLDCERYFFCHAGVRPGIPFSRQRQADLLWIREEFLTSNADFGKIVVHGHSPMEEPEVRFNRINIDTGAYETNRLTCVVLEGNRHRFIST